MRNVANKYAMGVGTEIDMRAAHYWATQGTRHGYRDCHAILSTLYATGGPHGIPENSDKAIFHVREGDSNYTRFSLMQTLRARATRNWEALRTSTCAQSTRRVGRPRRGRN